SRAYHALEKEGILGTIRGSRTVLESRDIASRVSFKGFIGLPLLPRISAENTILRLKDKGMRVVGIADGGASPILCKYEIRRDKALLFIFRKWRTDSRITHATIVRTSSHSAADEDMIEHAVERAGLSYEYLR